MIPQISSLERDMEGSRYLFVGSICRRSRYLPRHGILLDDVLWSWDGCRQTGIWKDHNPGNHRQITHAPALHGDNRGGHHAATSHYIIRGY